MENFLKNFYNFDTKDIDFDENKNYIFYNELKNKSGKRYSKITSNKEDINNYSSHSPSCCKLYNVLKKLNINKQDKIIDIGSGRGFALSIMNLFPFKEILGIEISRKDYEKNIQNFKILNISKIKLINIDINDFKEYDIYNYFYFYNPFNSVFFENIIKKIKKKNSIIIYKNLHSSEKNILEKYGFKFLFEEEGIERNYKIFTKL